MARRETAIGLSRILSELPALLADANGQALWGKLLVTTVGIADSAGGGAAGANAAVGLKTDEDLLPDDEGAGRTEYSAAFVRLVHAAIPERYAFSALPAPMPYLVQNLTHLVAKAPGIRGLIDASPAKDQLRAAGLQ